ncbi:MAG: Eco57I restriction-modification methylase domain-containing protein [Candidatus Polarisedimenticolia bacterium]
MTGQHATRADVADLAGAFCIGDGCARVLDPSCGEGVFLQRAALRLRASGAGSGGLTGVEIDAALARAARRRVPGATIVPGDFLALAASPAAGRHPSPRRPFDAIIGNPPYVRHELLGAARKKELAALGGREGWPRLSGRCDLHAWFWAPALSCLKDGGRLAWVVSATWMDAGYGAALRQWLTGHAALVAVVESDVESWFDEARVRTVIVVLEKGRRAAEGPARFVRLSSRLDEIAPTSLSGETRRARLDALASDIVKGGASGPGWRAREVESGGLIGSTWGSALAASELCVEMIGLAGERLVPLDRVATVRWGIKTGDDRVFFPALEDAPRMERGVLSPAVFRLADLDGVVVKPRHARRSLLLVDTRSPRHRRLLVRPGSRVAAWLREAEKNRATHRRPTCRARERHGAPEEGGRRWFELRPGPPGAILWSIMHQYRHLAPLNPAGCPANDNLLLIDPRPGVSPRLLAALLNSHVQALLKEAAGRRRNEGMLKMQAADVRRMLVPDPRRITAARAAAVIKTFDALAGRRIDAVTAECLKPDRIRLDRAVLAALGLPGRTVESMARRIAADLTAMHARERVREGDAVRSRRRGRALRSAGGPG